jgi:hypothetical protein
MTDIVERLRDTAAAWRFDRRHTAFMREAADEIERLRKAGYGGLHYDLAEKQRQEIERLTVALEIIAGRRQCLDNLMSNADVVRAALGKSGGTLAERSRDDGTVVAVGGEPGASAGKSE